MNTILVFALLLGAPVAQQQTSPPPEPQAQPAPRPDPCDAPEFRQFDFWIGDWDVVGPKGQKAGSNIIEPLAGNCGIHENWTGAGGGLGRSLNTYDRADGKWHQFWVGNGGMILRLSGGLRDGKMVLEGTTTGPRGETMHRITWSPLEDGRVRQFWETSPDGDTAWNVAFDGYYSRKSRH